MKFFKIVITAYADYLPTIPSLIGKPAAESDLGKMVFGNSSVYEVTRNHVPEKCIEVLEQKSIQLKLPLGE